MFYDWVGLSHQKHSVSKKGLFWLMLILPLCGNRGKSDPHFTCCSAETSDRQSQPNQTDFPSELIIWLWQTSGKPSASIKCPEHLTCPERRDQNHANSLKTTRWALMWHSAPRQAGAEHLCQALLMCTSGSGCCTPGSFRAGRQSKPSHPSWREEGRQAARSAT